MSKQFSGGFSPVDYSLSVRNSVKLSATNFDKFVLKETKADGSQIWTVTWKNATNSFSYDITFPKGQSALMGDFDSKSALEKAFPTGLSIEQFAFVKDGDDLFIATYKTGVWNYKLLNNRIVFKKTDTVINYKFSDEDDSKYREFVKISDLKGDSPDFEWDGQKIRFKKADGTWGDWVNLGGKPLDPVWVDGTKLGWSDGKTLTPPVDLRGIKGDNGSVGKSDKFTEAYSTASGDVMFKLQKEDGTLYEIEWDNALPSIASFTNFGDYMGAFDINNIPTEIKKGQYWRTNSPFNYNSNYYPSGSIIIANKDKTTNVEKVDFDFYANRGSSVNVKIEEETFNITQDTIQLTLSNFDNLTDSALVMVAGSVKAGFVILNEGVDFNYTSGNVINITSTKLINGDKVVVKKYKNTKITPVRTWNQGDNYFKDDIVRDEITNGIYMALKDVPNSQIRPSISSDGSWTNISQVSRIASFDLNAPYDVEDVVLYGGVVYQCILATPKADKTPDNDSTHWKSLVPRGESVYDIYVRTTTDNPKKTEEQFLSSLKGSGLTYRGVYSPTERYYNNDYVTYSGKIFVIITNNANGIANVTPINDGVNYSTLFEGNIDPVGIIDDSLNTNNSRTWSTSKIYNELLLKANKDDVVLKSATTPFMAINDNQPVTLGKLKDYVATGIGMDGIQDGVTYVKTENNFNDDYKSKVDGINDNNLGVFASLSSLQTWLTTKGKTARENDWFVNTETNGTFWTYKNGTWIDSKASNGSGLSVEIYDPSGVKKDIYDVTFHKTSDLRDFVTKEEKLKLQNLATNKLDSKEILSNTIKNMTVPCYSSTLDRFVYKPYIDIGDIAYFSFSKLKRIDTAADPLYNYKYYVVFDRDLRCPFLFQPESKQFLEMRGQSKIALFPANPVDKQTFTGLFYVYEYSSIDFCWYVKSEIPKDTQTDIIKANTIQPINQLLEFKDSTGNTSLGNIDTTGGSNKLTWQRDVDIKGDLYSKSLTTTGNVNVGNTLSTPMIKTGGVQTTSTNLLHIYDKDGTSMANFNGTTKLLTVRGGVSVDENSTFLKDVTIGGKIINTDLENKLKGTGQFKVMTSAERLTFINNVDNAIVKTAIYDTDLDKQFFWNGTHCYESPDGVTNAPSFPPTNTLIDGLYHYDINTEVVYRWNATLKYFGLIDNDFLDVITGISGTSVSYALANNVSLSITRNVNYALNLVKLNGYAKLRYMLRTVGSPLNPTVNEATLSDGVSNISNMLDEGKMYELYISDVNNGQTYNIKFMFVGNSMLVKDKWNTLSVSDVRNNYESITTSSRQLPVTVPTPTKGIKTYYDENLKKDISINTQGLWFEYAGEIIENFPTSTTDGQLFTSAGGNKYIYRTAAKYWEYQKSQTISIPNADYLLCSVNGGTQTTITTDTDLTSTWKTTPIINQGDITIPSAGRFRLAPNKSYKIRCNLGVAMSASTNDMSFTIRNYTTGTNIGVNGKVGGDAVNTNLSSGEAVAYIKTGSTSVDIGVRINFIRVVNTATTFYEASGGVAGSYIEIEQIESSVRQLNVDFVNQPTLLNLQKTTPSSKADGDIWYDTASSNLTFRQGSNDVILNNDTFNDNLCLVTYYFAYGNFNASNNPVAGKFFFGNYMNTIGSTTQVQGNSANNPTWGGTGSSQWTLPKGVWSIRYWHINGDSPDSTTDWSSTVNIQKNGVQIHNSSMTKSNNVNGLDFTINGSIVVRSNGTDTIKFSTVNFALYSNNTPNGFYVQFEKLM